MNNIFKKLDRLKPTDANALRAIGMLRMALSRPLAVNVGDIESMAEQIISGSDGVHPQLTVGLIPYDKPTLLDAYVTGKTAVLDISGGLTDRHVQGMSGAQPSYEGIASTLKVLDADESISNIVLRIQSSGGMVTGLFDCCEAIKGLSTPTVGLADGYAYSAGYALLSSCDEVYCVNDGGVGSVGVVMVLTNQAKKLENEGIEVLMVRSGKHKATMNPYESFDPTIVSELQEECDTIYDRFVSLVTSNMSLELGGVAGTEARCYNSDKALSLGLIDGVKSFECILNENEVSRMDEFKQLQAENEVLKAKLDAWAEAGTATLSVLGADEAISVTAETMPLLVENQLLKATKTHTAIIDNTVPATAGEKVDLWADYKGGVK